MNNRSQRKSIHSTRQALTEARHAETQLGPMTGREAEGSLMARDGLTRLHVEMNRHGHMIQHGRPALMNQAGVKQFWAAGKHRRFPPP